MAHPEQFQFLNQLKQTNPLFFKNKLVLEIGSLNINGTIRTFFEDCVHIGVDVAEGPCVDVVCLGHNYNMPDNSFDVTISCECFEHDPYWQKTFTNMHRLCRHGGMVTFTCATDGRKEHGTKYNEPQSSPFTVEWNYYKNLNSKDFLQNFDLDKMFEKYEFRTNIVSHDLYFYGFKK